MEEGGTSGFLRMAMDAGLPRKSFYTLTEAAGASGIPRTVLRDAALCGDLTSFLPVGRKRGTLVKPEWIDEWIAEGVG